MRVLSKTALKEWMLLWNFRRVQSTCLITLKLPGGSNRIAVLVYPGFDHGSPTASLENQFSSRKSYTHSRSFLTKFGNRYRHIRNRLRKRSLPEVVEEGAQQKFTARLRHLARQYHPLGVQKINHRGECYSQGHGCFL